MNKSILVAALFATVSLANFAAPATAGTAVPCEDGLKTLEETLKTTTPSAADLVTINELKTKAAERCVAEDDRRADGFIEEAMKLLAKK